MADKTKRKHARYPKVRKEPWRPLEGAVFVLAVVFALMITWNGIAAVVRSIQADRLAQQAADAESEPYYMTFIRGVWNAAVGTDEEEGAEEGENENDDEFTYDTTVDISAYADDTGYAGRLYQLKDEYDQVYAILAHYDEIPERLIRMALNNYETMDYVAQYVTLKDVTQTIDLSEEAESETVPLLLQWDTRWGYETYGSGLVGYTGCGPTCIAMVALFLTGDTDWDPGSVAVWADSAGYYVSGSGTAWTLMSVGCEHFGIVATELTLSESIVAEHIAAGEPIICSVGPGDFTSDGHYIVLTGYEDGVFTLNDPNSLARSSQTWTWEQLSGQIKNLWAYTVQ
ncbi:MAG: C39 family peptidase [Clostridiales bacterium]|nr:C39 family peptidase [Clostridiales bacterium]